ncbi:MAG: hypothetical protein AAF483_08780 [Planctomycetota bacterium]
MLHSFLLLVLASLSCLQEGVPFLPRCNYWELSAKIVREPELQQDLAIDPGQLGQIRAMRANPEFGVLLRAKMLEMRSTKRREPFSHVVSKAGDDRRLALVELDSIVENQLREILTGQQFRMLRPWILRKRFRDSYQVFLDPEVQGFANIDNELAAVAKQEGIVLNARIRDATQSHARVILDGYPDTQKRLVDYLGNGLYPLRRVDNAIPCSEIPFPPLSRTSTSFVTLSRSEAEKSLLEMNSKQILELREVVAQQNAKLTQYAKEGDISRLSQFYRELTKDSLDKIEALLTQEQLLKLYRLRAYADFSADFERQYGGVNCKSSLG